MPFIYRKVPGNRSCVQFVNLARVAAERACILYADSTYYVDSHEADTGSSFQGSCCLGGIDGYHAETNGRQGLRHGSMKRLKLEGQI